MKTPFTAWFTGLPGSGKTTLATLLAKHLQGQEVPCALLDGDDIRERVKGILGFSHLERLAHISYSAAAAALLNESGICVAASFVSPSKESRRKAREIIGTRFFEIYLSCKPEVAQVRRHNPSWNGVLVPYEEPDRPDLTLDTTSATPSEILALILPTLQGE